MSSSMQFRSPWVLGILAIAVFWLSGNLILDFLVMPIMHLSGMTGQAGFAPTGYTLFWTFNRLELICVALMLTGILAVRRRPGEFEVAHSGSRCRWALGLGLGLLGITLLDTYVLTPQMSGMALALNAWAEQPTTIAPMNGLHAVYWGLEFLKVCGLGGMVALCLEDITLVDAAEDAIA